MAAALECLNEYSAVSGGYSIRDAPIHAPIHERWPSNPDASKDDFADPTAMFTWSNITVKTEVIELS